MEQVAPFLVTSENLDCPILGYNAIEELVRNDQNPIPTVYDHFPGKDKANLDALVNFIQSTSSNHICSIKTGRKYVVIPKNHTVNVDCRANTDSSAVRSRDTKSVTAADVRLTDKEGQGSNEGSV